MSSRFRRATLSISKFIFDANEGFNKGKCCTRVGRKMSTFNWTHIYVAGPDNPLYFSRSASQSESESRLKVLDNSARCFLFTVAQSLAGSFREKYVLSALQSHPAYRQSGTWPSALFAHSVFISNSLNGSPEECTPLRGVFCTVMSNDYIPDVKLNAVSLSEEMGLTLFELIEKEDETYVLKLLSKQSASKSAESEVSLELVDQSSIRCLHRNGNQTSPIFEWPEISPVFHTFEDSKKVLLMLKDVPEVKELLEIAEKHVQEESRTTSGQKLKHPFVVVEGMDATGKTTLTEKLEKEMNAVRLYTPPCQITHLRAAFDKYPEIVRRAYYSLGNYIVAQDIKQHCQTRPVIMDRFWHSTAAYGIANETSSGDMPNLYHPVYNWPSDLLKPTAVLFLTVSEVVRKLRLTGRGLEATFEEKSLDKDQLFRQRLCEAYRRMTAPSCIEINAGGTVEEVFHKAVEVLADHGVSLSSTK